MAAWWSKVSRRPWGVVGLVAILLAVGGGTWWFLQRDNGTAAAAGTTTTTRTVAAAVSTITSQISASGSVTPAVQDPVSFGASGRVTAVEVAAGQTVTKGQVLGTIDTVNLEAALASAKATLASAQAKLTAARTSLTTAQTTVTTDTTAVTTAQTAVTTAAGTTDTTDDTTAAAALTVAKSALTNATAQVPAAQAQVSADQAQVTSAQTGVKTATTALGSATLRSPISGLVATVGVAVGDSVSGVSASAGASTGSSGTAGGSGGTGTGGSGSSGSSGTTSTSTAPFLIVSTASWIANVTVDDSSINLIKKGIQAQLTVGSSTTPLFGTVSSVGLISTASGSTASYPVVVAVTGSPTGLHDGATATVSLIYRQLSNVLTVPTAAIHTTTTGKVVDRVVNGQQVSTTVTTGEVGNGVTQILTGLAEGDEVQVISASGTRSGTGTGSRTGNGGYGGFNGGAGGFNGGAGGAGVPGGGGAGGFTGGQNGGGFTGGGNTGNRAGG